MCLVTRTDSDSIADTDSDSGKANDISMCCDAVAVGGDVGGNVAVGGRQTG